MLDRFLQMFSKPKLNLSDEARDFISTLAASDIWILAIGVRGTPALPCASDPAIYAAVAAHRKELSEIGDDDSVVPFNYEREGRQILPFFSSEERAKHFLANGGLGDISLFQPYSLLAGFVTAPENERFELLLDPCSPSERTLTRDERQFLRSVCTPAA